MIDRSTHGLSSTSAVGSCLQITRDFGIDRYCRGDEEIMRALEADLKRVIACGTAKQIS